MAGSLDCMVASALLAKQAMLSQCGCQGIALLLDGSQLLLQVVLVVLQLLQYIKRSGSSQQQSQLDMTALRLAALLQ